MYWELLSVVMGIATIVITAISFFICLPRKYSMTVTIIAFAALFILLIVLNHFTGHINKLPLPNGWPYIPLVIILFNGHVYQKLFLLFSQLFMSLAIILFFSMIFGFFVPYGSAKIFFMMLAIVLLVSAGYIIFIFRFGRELLKKFFIGGSKSEWAFYMITAFVAYIALFVLRKMHIQNNLIHFGILIFLIWSFIILCFAIINTHDRMKQKQEADFARDIISTGRGHYQKMSEQYDVLRVIKHDVKFHINTALEMLKKGEVDRSNEYLTGLQNQLSEKELPNYCGNPVINSLAADYVRKCGEFNITLNISISIPDNFLIHNYEMCIVLGNLMENAVEACQKLESNRQIKLIIKTKGEQLVLMVRNTFDGNVEKEGDKFISTKKEGGIGLESVIAVVRHYGEMFRIKYDSQWFSVFVLWK
ncbi:MAG: GHKL domain-containing protein [Treponema sp.]|nr:GHKL domain-containing protein [Treponema sp.]